ncbi:MAG TPA: hypothetical protein DIT64_08690 [Verrucomicrobiales bacterium]|nr:hypothetical protein [Verrucomicrobiales bacterium]
MPAPPTIDPDAPDTRKPLLPLRPVVALWHLLLPPTQAHADRQTRKARWIAGGVVAALALGVAGLGFAYARPLKDTYKNWRTERLLAEARRLMDDKKYFNAITKVQQAVSLSPSNVNAVRLNSVFLTAMKRPEAIYFLDKLDQLGATTLDDRKTRVQAYMNLHRGRDASALMEELLAEHAPDEDLMRLAGLVWGESRNKEQLLKPLKTYAENHPEDSAHSLRLARVQTESVDAAETVEGIRRAWRVAEEDGETGLAAIEFLASFESLPPDETARLIERLRRHPMAGARHQAEALKRQTRLDPARRPQHVQEVLSQARGKKREELVPHVRWLVDQKEFAQVLALVSEEEAKSYQPLLENYLTALTMLGRFDDLERLVADPGVNKLLNETMKAFYRAHLAFVTRKPPREFREALVLARAAAEVEKRGEICLRLAEYAEARGHPDIAQDAYRSASQMARTERAGHLGLLRASAANGNTAVFLESARAAVERWPDDPLFVEQLAYANLIVGHQVENSIAELRRLLEQRPDDPGRLLMLALAHWRLRDAGTSIEVLGRADVAGLTPGQRAVYAALAKGQTDEEWGRRRAEAIRGIDRQAAMLPEERQFLERALR